MEELHFSAQEADSLQLLVKTAGMNIQGHLHKTEVELLVWITGCSSAAKSLDHMNENKSNS